MLPLTALIQCIWMLLAFHNVLSNPIHNNDDIFYIESQINNYRKRLGMLALRVDQNFNGDLQRLIDDFDAALNTHDMKKEEFLLENYPTILDPEFAIYLQNQLDAQHLNQDINADKWFFEQLKLQAIDTELKADIELLLPKFDKARQAQSADEKFEYFTNIENAIPQRLLDFILISPAHPSILNVQLQYFQEFLLYLLEKNIVGEFENEIKTLLSEVEQALSSEASKDIKIQIIDRFDRIETRQELFLDAKLHEFELDKFGLE